MFAKVATIKNKLFEQLSMPIAKQKLQLEVRKENSSF